MKRKELNQSSPSINNSPGWLSFDIYQLFKKTRQFLFLFICAGWSVACEEVPCTTDPETLIGIEFYDRSSAGLAPKKYLINQVLIRNSRVFLDTVSGSTAAIRIRFPSNSDSFWLSFRDTTSKDSIRFSYSRTMEFAGESCGYYYGFQNLKVDSISGANFDRAQILINQGDSSNKVHVRIFW